ncbi:MAG TPA: T9SS type A sorting domain-containing protein [Ignavibacteria bacterium]
MKKIFLISILIFINLAFGVDKSFSQRLIDTASAKYIPLAVGNVYKFHYSSSGGINYDYKNRIIGDTIISSKKYFVMSGYSSGLLRYDSVTGNYYRRSGYGYCSYSPNEILMDSLASKKSDTAKDCLFSSKHVCTDTSMGTLFGLSVKSKTFTQSGMEGSQSVIYCRGFGISGYYYSDIGGIAFESLVGCFINGILYGDTTLTMITNINTQVPKRFALYQNFPNPFNPTTKIKFDIAPFSRGAGGVLTSLKVFDITGREIQTFVNEKLNPGTYEVTFDGSNYASGVYFYQLRTGDFVVTKKLILLK